MRGRGLAVATGVAVVFGMGGPAVGADSPASAPASLSCRGEEPFWGLDLTPTAAMMTTLDGRTERTGSLDVLDWLPPGWLVWRSAPAEPRLVAVLRAEACFSTMADEPARSHRVLLIEGDARAAAGCCTVSAASDAPPAASAAPPDRPPSVR
ncbi:MAG TPA: hypothetical protein VES39_01530 [Rhodospirillales bacterium]|nr:hypothetical protein [Rhodospirillales bacterium]